MTREVEFAKLALATGTPILTKAMLTAAISKRAGEIRRAGESEAKAFVRAMNEDEDGKTLYRASKVAPGPEVVPEKPSTPAAPKPIGPAHAELEARARDHLLAHPELAERRGVKDGGKAAAVAAIYGNPHNYDLRERVKGEHFASLAKAAA